MFKKFLLALLITGFSLQAEMIPPRMGMSESEGGINQAPLQSYALMYNQALVSSGNILWQPSNLNSDDIKVDNLGNITLPKDSIYLVQYTVRLTKVPADSTSTAVIQLQQTAAGVPTNITQPAVTTNTAIDSVNAAVPSSQSQITGYALINTSGDGNYNQINLTVTLTGGAFTIPATSGLDANAELVILRLRHL